ncbi:hypothetical protein BDN70DRAFT_995458 [Pholiota conissans]|uniref:DUF5745 domain-containing protein n=1 Tax=Pholiota conissans TaxID=109636 RepID=A0A9P5YW14_9AGAR|nr:hypothetical protein BDN70DRAFT_995458 [Pholiota conissans]
MDSRSTSFDAHATELDEVTLADQLNDMLNSLNLPISLISPTDLTPSLLIAILESILAIRMPIVDRDKESKRSRASKIQNMKIFLGVLETDVLKADVGLSNVDPRRLADGECDEVYFVAELLCWIGRKMGFIQRHKYRLNGSAPGSVPPQATGRPPSPKSQLDLDAESLFQGGSNSTVTGSLRNGIVSPFFKATSDSNTSLFSGGHESESEDGYSDNVSDILGALSPLVRSEPNLPRYDHEIPSPSDSLLLSVDPRLHSSPGGHEQPLSSFPFQQLTQSHSDGPFLLEHHYLSKQSRSPVRYSGFIEQVDEDSELESFEHSRSISLSGSISSQADMSKQSVKIDSAKKQYTRTLELLNERARLLQQLAALKNSHG